jgi:hypothetical protein
VFRGSSSSLNDIPLRASDYQADQKRKKAELVDEQLAALRSLNSPLPMRTAAPKAPARQKPVFQPQKPVGATRRSPTPAQSLGDLANTIKNPPRANVHTPITSEAKPGHTQHTPGTSAVEDNRSSFNPFSRPGSNNPSNPTGVAPTTPENTSPPQVRRGPIRMELPLREDEEEPAMTEGMTIGEIMKRQKASGSGDDQDRRSKQWGVDMSRFQK